MELNFTPEKTMQSLNINSINLPESCIKNAKSAEKTQKIADFCENFKKINNFSDNEIIFEAELSNDNFLSEPLKKTILSDSDIALTIFIKSDPAETVRLKINLDDFESLVSIINIKIGENVHCNMVMEFFATHDEKINNLSAHIEAMENSECSFIFLSNFTKPCTNLVSIETIVQKNAKSDTFIVDFNSKYSIFNYKCKLVGFGATGNLSSLYFSDGDSVTDLNYLIEVIGEKCKTKMEVLGALSDTAKKHFKGTINFLKGCKQSVGAENEYCILLGNDARSKALPMLLCTEEDVDGKHSSSVGKVDEKQLFYITSRGLTHAEATRLIVKAKFNEIIKNLFDDGIASLISENIDRKIQ